MRREARVLKMKMLLKTMAALKHKAKYKRYSQRMSSADMAIVSVLRCVV